MKIGNCNEVQPIHFANEKKSKISFQSNCKNAELAIICFPLLLVFIANENKQINGSSFIVLRVQTPA